MNKKDSLDVEQRYKEPPKRYMWLGYGDYVNYGGAVGRMLDGGLLRSPATFEPIFEALGWKKKPRKRSEGQE